MKLITNNTDPLDSTGVVIRADVTPDGKGTVFKVIVDGVLLDTIVDNSVLTVANNVDAATVAKQTQVAANAYSKVPQ